VGIKFGLNESEGHRFLLNITAPRPSSKSKSSKTLLSTASKVFNEVGIARKILVEAGINVNVFWKRRAIFSVFEENLPDKALS